MSKEELIKHWAEDIIPCVFMAEDELMRKHPEWRERLKNVPADKRQEVAEKYCRAIAEEIINNQK